MVNIWKLRIVFLNAKCENAELFSDILENLCQAHSFVLLFVNASYCENGPLDGTFTSKMARSTSFVLFFTTLYYGYLANWLECCFILINCFVLFSTIWYSGHFSKLQWAVSWTSEWTDSSTQKQMKHSVQI